MLKGVVLGCYSFVSKKGNDCIKITVEDKHSDSLGTCADSVIIKKSSCPVGMKDLIGKSIAVDSRNGFGSDLFIIK